jgi:hypothetical protein
MRLLVLMWFSLARPLASCSSLLVYFEESSCLPVPMEEREERDAASESESPGGWEGVFDAGCDFAPGWGWVVEVDDAVDAVSILGRCGHWYSVLGEYEAAHIVDVDEILLPLLAREIPHQFSIQAGSWSIRQVKLFPFAIVQPVEEVLMGL